MRFKKGLVKTAQNAEVMIGADINQAGFICRHYFFSRKVPLKCIKEVNEVVGHIKELGHLGTIEYITNK